VRQCSPLRSPIPYARGVHRIDNLPAQKTAPKLPNEFVSIDEPDADKETEAPVADTEEAEADLLLVDDQDENKPATRPRDISSRSCTDSHRRDRLSPAAQYRPLKAMRGHLSWSNATGRQSTGSARNCCVDTLEYDEVVAVVEPLLTP
jgi:hypothetical protein